MRIAIFGSTSWIAKDLIQSFAAKSRDELVLYARRPENVRQWLGSVGLSGKYSVVDFSVFSVTEQFDVILNFVGVGNPAQAALMGASIFDVTLKYDELALSYVRENPRCRYIFLSSGAAYGSNFQVPVDENSKALIAINNLQPQNWYGMAKLHAECRHRSLAHLAIIDIRVFNYFSHTQDISARFFITDILRAIQFGETLMTTPENIVRDYIGPDDFFKLVSLILESPATNNVFDCYTRAPVDKLTLLSKMKEYFGLSYAIQKEPVGINATGVKVNYFSQNFRANSLGYLPSLNSLETIYKESEKLLNIS
jgi:nucleoside-diphosphate-sugar epimerase